MLTGLYFSRNVEPYKDISTKISNVIIIENGVNGEKEYVYLYKEGSKYKVFSETEPIEIDDNSYYVYQDYTGWLIFNNVIFYLSLGTLSIMFIVSFSDYNSESILELQHSENVSWDISFIYSHTKDMLMISEIYRADDFDKIYFVLRGKILFEFDLNNPNFPSSNTDNINFNQRELGEMYNSYKNHKNILKDYKGTLSDRRGENIDKLLEDEK